MIVLNKIVDESSEPAYELEVQAEFPLIYLDHWALRLLSTNPCHGDRFLHAFERRGTIMFSMMNVVEIARDQSEERAESIRRFLHRLGHHWIPMTIDPMPIIDAEETDQNQNGMHPCVSVGFLTDAAFVSRLAAGAVSLVHVVDLTRGSDGVELRNASDRNTAELVQVIQRLRDSYVANPERLDTTYPLLKFDPARPMRAIYYGLLRYAVTDTFVLNDNHARDLFHAIASVRCAQLVTLDAHWTAQVRKLHLPSEFVRVFNRASFDEFLARLEAAPPTRSP